MIKISRLAKSSGVSVSTIKHYVNEGLLPKPVKTGKTMAYYDEACVDRIKLIKRLQREKFLPLDVIKMMLDPDAPDTDEMELGEAMFKVHKVDPQRPPVAESKIEKHTGMDLSRLNTLETQGIICPSRTPGGKAYDAIDCEIIQIVKHREEIGLPFDYSVETMGAYRDAIWAALEKDIHRFVHCIMGSKPARQMVRLMTEGDDSLDRFLPLIREKINNSLMQTAVQQAVAMKENTARLSFLPVEGRDLPEKEPESPGLRAFYCFCTNNLQAVLDLEEEGSKGRANPDLSAARILARLMDGQTDAALESVTQTTPNPTGRTLENTVAGLAHVFAAVEAGGFSQPIFYIKRALEYLGRIEVAASRTDPIDLFGLYICGVVYTVVPDLFQTQETGLRLLRELDAALKAARPGGDPLPDWCLRTLAHEVFPDARVRVHRFLAQACFRLGKTGEGQEALDYIMKMGDPEGPDATWARHEALRLRGRMRRG